MAVQRDVTAVQRGRAQRAGRSSRCPLSCPQPRRRGRGRPGQLEQAQPDEARAAWTDLDAWVTWLRKAFGLPPTIIPPLWHRHDELVWELSSLHTHWLACYDPDASPSAPIAWMRDFADARHRLREWVAACGTRLDRDRPTRHTIWPGEPPEPVATDREITDRAADFTTFVDDDIASRHRKTHKPGGAS